MDLREVFEPVINFVKGFQKKERDNSKIKAKERLQLVLMQDRASVSPDFFEMMKKEIIEVIKKYIEIDEEALEVQLTRGFEGGLEGPALYANIPIKNVKPVAKKNEGSLECSEADKNDEVIETESDEAVNEQEVEAVSCDVEKGQVNVEIPTEVDDIQEEGNVEEIVEAVVEENIAEDVAMNEVEKNESDLIQEENSAENEQIEKKEPENKDSSEVDTTKKSTNKKKNKK